MCSLFGVHSAMLHGVVELLTSWSGKFKRHKVMVIGVCLIASWGIWIERNARTFERNERSIHNLKLKFFHSIQVAKCFGCFYFLFFARFTRFLYFPFKLAFVFFCFFFFSSSFLCALFSLYCYLFFINEVNYL